MWMSVKLIVAGLRAWWASQFMDEPPAFEIEPEEEEQIYHILPYPLPQDEEYRNGREL